MIFVNVNSKQQGMENDHVAWCGLYCGACKSLNKGKCLGCYENEKTSWSDIRKCCREHGYATCTDCTLMLMKECKKYNNFFARAIAFVTWTEQSKCIARIGEIGVKAFAEEMKAKGTMSIRKQ